MSSTLSGSKYSTLTVSCQAEKSNRLDETPQTSDEVSEYVPQRSSTLQGQGSLSAGGRGGENSIPVEKKNGVAGFDYKHFREELKSAWSEWLDGMEWDWYVTLTFKNEIHPEQAERNFRRWVRRLNEKRHGKRFRKKGKGISWVRAIEMQRRGVIHFHVLLKGLEGIRYLRGHRLWKVSGKRNGFSWIESYHPHRGATGYLGKYIGKGGDIDIYLNPQQTIGRL